MLDAQEEKVDFGRGAKKSTWITKEICQRLKEAVDCFFLFASMQCFLQIE